MLLLYCVVLWAAWYSFHSLQQADHAHARALGKHRSFKATTGDLAKERRFTASKEYIRITGIAQILNRDEQLVLS